MKQLGLYLRTLAYLRPSQAAYFLHRRILPQFHSVTKTVDARRRSGVSMLPGIAPPNSTGDDSHFWFLGQSQGWSAEHVDWACKDMPKLWRYNLHYFDYLQDSARSGESKSCLIDSWIQHNPPGTEDAWEPYTVSLRIVNWITFFLSSGSACCEDRSEELPKREWLESLYQQTLWLEHNIEYHILANHYLKNGKALFFAGAFFEGTDAKRWLEKGLRILTEEAQEQFLADGGHFERSPMYHSICLEDYLDALNLMTSNPVFVGQEKVKYLQGKANRALDFLNDICLPDRDIPLFNDSAFGIAHPPVRLFEYARRIFGYERTSPPANLAVSGNIDSGYFVMRNDGDMMIIDCGSVGPDYQPGHSHCDTLSYELALDGRRVVIDSGVFDYEPSPERGYARSTRAHNTVMVDGQEQSEIWGAFRMARRARPIGASISRLPGNGVRFEGTHDGYRRLPGQVMHKRVIDYDGNGTWTVLDELTGTGKHEAESYINLHPDYAVKQNQDSIAILEKDGKVIGRLDVVGNTSIRLEGGQYFPEFGRMHEKEVIVLSCSGPLPLKFGYRICKEH